MPGTSPHYAVGWAWAGDTPFQWTKQVASHFGGTRNSMIVVVAQDHQGHGQGALAVPPRHRRHAHAHGSGRHRRADRCQRPYPEAHRRREPGVHLLRGERRMRPAGARSNTSRCSATVRSTTTAGSRVAATVAFRGSRPARRSPKMCGSCTTSPRTSARRWTWPSRSRRSCWTCGCASSATRRSTTCCRWTTASPSASTSRCGPASSPGETL